MSEQKDAKPAAASRWNGRLSLPVTLASSITALVLVAVVGVFAIGWWSARQNTLSLLRDKASLGIALITTQVSQHLEPARAQGLYIADLIARGRVDPADEPRLSQILLGALAAAPQIKVVALVDRNHRLLGARRTEDGPTTYSRDYSADPVIREAVASLESADEAVWGPPIWRQIFGETIVNLRQPLRRDGAYIGFLVAAVTVGQLSDYLGRADTRIGNNAFILHGRDMVLAHPNLIGGVSGLSVERPLPPLASFGDPVLASMWNPELRMTQRIELPPPLEHHGIRIGREIYIFVYRELSGYSDRPWLVGAYFRASDVNTELKRLVWAALAGVGMIVVAAIAAVVLGRRIARPVVRLAEAASHVGSLEFSKVADLDGSVFRELNDQATAFNAMLRGLRWFESYVPRTLVRRLVRRGQRRALPSVEREVTVMFTDVGGFTRRSEGRPAAEVADFLNRHFALVTEAIEAEGGTVDKYIGDAVMAFWGAPARQPDHARRAARAALAIARAVRGDNVRLRAAGEVPVSVRVGVHTGPAIVGNIGAPGRINYTIVGDTVNTAQRIEQLCKEAIGRDAETAVLVSGATAARLGAAFTTAAAGRYAVPGRRDEVEVFRLEERRLEEGRLE